MDSLRSAFTLAASFFRAPDLPHRSRRTFRYHIAFALFDAAAAGILSNAGIMAVKGLAAEDWHLGTRLLLSSAGMFATLFLGHWMAPRRKMPFVVVPGMAFAICSLAASLTSQPLWFLLLLGVGSAFEVAARPAITAIVRMNYPATHRGTAEGEIRKWSSLVFLSSILLSAWLLNLNVWSDHSTSVIRIQLIVAGLLSLCSFCLFHCIRVNETIEPEQAAAVEKPPLTGAARILIEDSRFRRYLLSSFLFGLGGLLYAPYLAAFLVKDLELDYLPAALFLHVIPSTASFVVTGFLGRWIDRTNPWTAWGWMRTGWGLDPLCLAAAPLFAGAFPPAVLLLPVLGRLLRGSSMGGSWVLWWRVGINHFAPPGADTTRYMGIFVFLNGAMRLLAPILGGWLIYRFSRQDMLLVGGLGVLASAVHAFYEGLREKRQARLTTIADFEAGFAEPIREERPEARSR